MSCVSAELQNKLVACLWKLSDTWFVVEVMGWKLKGMLPAHSMYLILQSEVVLY